MRTNYDELVRQLQALMAEIPYRVSNLANASALLWLSLPDINLWDFTG